MISERTVKKRYQYIKNKAIHAFQIKDYERSLRYIKYACSYLYEFNFDFLDLELEELGRKIAQQYYTSYCVTEDKILFYEFSPMDVRGLAYIYLKALVDSGRKFIWVTYKSYNTYEQKRLIHLVERCANGKIVVLNDTNGSIKLIKEWYSIIEIEKPRIALLIPAPWDVECLSVFTCKTDINRILVNGTDHTFWYGVNTFDKVLEFRDWGFEVSKRYRGIQENKLIKFPYYPRPSEQPYEGLPFTVKENTKLIVSGGNFYKIYGSSVFLDTVKYILDRHKECIFYFMGSGDDTLVKKFINDNNLGDRFYISKERKDFDEVIKNSYLYLNTYPLIGALMTQYAVANNVIPVGLNTSVDGCNDVSGLFLNHSVNNCNTKDDLWKELDRLISNNSYYMERKSALAGALLDEKRFSHELMMIIDGDFNGYDVGDSSVNLEELRKPYLNRQKCMKAFIKYLKNLFLIRFRLGL